MQGPRRADWSNSDRRVHVLSWGIGFAEPCRLSAPACAVTAFSDEALPECAYAAYMPCIQPLDKGAMGMIDDV